MGKMTLPGFTGEASLYTSTNGYVVASNRAAGSGGAVLPAARSMDGTSGGYHPGPGVVFMMKKICWDPTGSTSRWFGLTFQRSCQVCQWFSWRKVCPSPPACYWGWVAEGEAEQECSTTLVAID